MHMSPWESLGGCWVAAVEAGYKELYGDDISHHPHSGSARPWFLTGMDTSHPWQ